MKVYEALRRAQQYEQDTLADFCAEAFHASSEYFLRRWRLDPSRRSFGVVLEDEGELVGYLRVYDRELRVGEETLRCAGIGNVAVSDRHRGRGHSLRLLEGAIAEATEAGFDVSLLYTHIPGLYERVGFRNLPFHVVALTGEPGDGWYFAGAITEEDRGIYEAEHGWRPGTVGRSQTYWDIRDEWLRAESWRILKHHDEDGYGYVRFTAQGGVIDEATGGVARRLDIEAPRPGLWKRLLPNSARSQLGVNQPTNEFVMARDLSDSNRVAKAFWSEAVFWQTDAF